MEKINLSFNVTGDTISSDHNYYIHSAIKSKMGLKDELVCTIPGIPIGNGKIALSKHSKFRMRINEDKLSTWVEALKDSELTIGRSIIKLFSPMVDIIKPSKSLTSRIVLFQNGSQLGKNRPDIILFLASCYKALEKIGVTASIEVGNISSFRCKRCNLLGYKVTLTGLSDEDSIKVQANGIGSGTHLGCGWFY